MLKYSKISTQKINKILLCFSEDLTATKTAKLLNLNRRTIDRYFSIFRDKIFEFTKIKKVDKKGFFECDESYFGAKRIRGKRGRGAAGKTPVFGLLKRNGKVYVKVVKNYSKEQLMPIIQGKVLEGSTIHTDGWKSYDGLILNGYTHYRVHHSKDEFARGKCHVNGIESFWSFTKRRLAKFNGIASHKFLVYLKECEFRWNYRGEIFEKMKKIIKKF
jgi:transposase-like protein